MRFIGLPGKSFVSMLVGFGCNVPAIMATPTLENRRDRLMTVLMNLFMSCGARELARDEAGVAEAEGFDLWGGIGKAFASIPANLAEVPSTLLDPLGIIEAIQGESGD